MVSGLLASVRDADGTPKTSATTPRIRSATGWGIDYLHGHDRWPRERSIRERDGPSAGFVQRGGRRGAGGGGEKGADGAFGGGGGKTPRSGVPPGPPPFP